MPVGSWACQSEAHGEEVRRQGVGLGITHSYGVEGHRLAEIIQGTKLAKPEQGSED